MENHHGIQKHCNEKKVLIEGQYVPVSDNYFSFPQETENLSLSTIIFTFLQFLPIATRSQAVNADLLPLERVPQRVLDACKG